MASEYSLQIVRKSDGQVLADIEPGSRVEIDIIDDMLDRASEKGIGWFKSETSTKRALRAAAEEMILDLKRRVRPGHPV